MRNRTWETSKWPLKGMVSHVLLVCCRRGGLWWRDDERIAAGAALASAEPKATTPSATADVAAALSGVTDASRAGAGETDVRACQGKRMYQGF